MFPFDPTENIRKQKVLPELSSVNPSVGIIL